MVKISPTFPERMIDTVCYAAQMYKVELREQTIRHHLFVHNESQRLFELHFLL